MSVLIAHASINENGQAKGGQAGDQTKREVCIREWYSKPWNVLIRFKDRKKAERFADDMEWAAKNDNIGYNQLKRNTALNKARKYNYNLSKVTEPCECDCSSLVSIACMYAGIPESVLTLNGNCATTRTIKNLLLSTGEVEVYTSPLYLTKTDRLLRGDILCAEGHHIVGVVQTEEKQKKSVHEIALEVIKGKWGTGIDRKNRLQQAGYSFSDVQNEVNAILKANKPVSKEDVPKFVWDYLMVKIGNPYGVAGLMGNLKAESGLNPKNLQNSCEKKLGMTDEQYVQAVDNGTYKNFCNDLCGFGIAQWTSNGRKRNLYEYRGDKSIGDLSMQLGFLYNELCSSYKNVLKVLQTADNVTEASDAVLTKYERPKNQSDEVKDYRARLGIEFYKKFCH